MRILDLEEPLTGDRQVELTTGLQEGALRLINLRAGDASAKSILDAVIGVGWPLESTVPGSFSYW